MRTLFILNDSTYGTERSYNGLRLANALANVEGQKVKVFLIGDAVACSKRGQKVPQGYYNTELMLKNGIEHKIEVGVCGTCLDARGIVESELVKGTSKSTLIQLAEWTTWAAKVLTF